MGYHEDCAKKLILNTQHNDVVRAARESGAAWNRDNWPGDKLILPDDTDPTKFGDDICDSLDKLVHKQGVQSFKAHLVNYFLSLGVLENNHLRRKIVQSAVNQVKFKKDMSSRVKIDGKEYILSFDGHVGKCVNVSAAYLGVNEMFTWTPGYGAEED